MHPIQFEVDTPEQRNRVTVLFRIILVIPHAIVMALWGIAVGLATIGQWFIVLFTGARNGAISDFQRTFLRYMANVSGYLWLLHDKFPAFSADDPASPVRFSVAADAEPPNRLTNALRMIWIIPAYVIFYFLNIANEVLSVVNWLMIVFTGKAPSSTIDFVERVQRYALRTGGYAMLLTDKYPVFD